MAPSGGVSNPENWDNRYREGDTPWDKSTPAPALCDFLAQDSITGRVLIPGCGAGHDVREIARHGAEAVGLDFAPRAIDTARTFPKAGVETYLVADLFHLPKKQHHAYDWVFEHTCFCAIDPKRRADYVKAVAGALKPGGKLLAVFFLNPDHHEDGPPYGVTRVELDDFFDANFKLIREWNPEHYYPGREDRELVRLLQKS